jgi:hypothetical protein
MFRECVLGEMRRASIVDPGPCDPSLKVSLQASVLGELQAYIWNSVACVVVLGITFQRVPARHLLLA